MSASKIYDETHDYIVGMDGDDLVVSAGSGLILASSDPSKIGHKLPASQEGKSTSKDSQRGLQFKDGDQEVTVLSGGNRQSYEDVLKAFTRIYIDEHLKRGSTAGNATDQFVRRLIAEHNPDAEFYRQMEAEAKILGYDLSGKRNAIIMTFDNFFQDCLLANPASSYDRERLISDWKDRIERTLSTFFTKNKDMITAYLGENSFVIFKALGDCPEEKFAKLMKSAFGSIFGPLRNHAITDIQVGFGRAYSGITGLTNSYNEAEFALDIGQVFLNRSGCYFFGDLGILYILADGNRNKKIQFANQLLAKLRNQELMRTLEAFFENNLNISDTADNLGIHRNTVIYRLDRLTNYLNLDPRNFIDAMTIKIALLLKKISNANHFASPAK